MTWRRLVLPPVGPACILVILEWVIFVWNLSRFPIQQVLLDIALWSLLLFYVVPFDSANYNIRFSILPIACLIGELVGLSDPRSLFSSLYRLIVEIFEGKTAGQQATLVLAFWESAFSHCCSVLGSSYVNKTENVAGGDTTGEFFSTHGVIVHCDGATSSTDRRSSVDAATMA